MSIARKNGKTALIAALSLAHLVGPEAIENGEIYSAANDREQAGQVFKVARQLVAADPELRELLRIVPSTKTIVNYANGSFYRAVSAEAGTKFGLNPTVVIFDELAQAKNRDLYDALDTAMGARQEPLFIVISTQSNDPAHILSQLIDDGLNADDPSIVCHLHAVDDDAEDIFDEKVWKDANPALGVFRSLEDLRKHARRAKRLTSFDATFRNLYLNQRVSPISPLIPKPEWVECAGEAEFTEGEPVYLALDLSTVHDLSALMMVSAGDEKSRVMPWLWKPEDWLEEHSNRDFGHGNHRYVEWARQGLLETTPGRVIDHAVIAAKLAELCSTYDVLGCAYDRHKIDYLLKELDRVDLQSFKEGDSGDGLKIIPWGQGFVSMSPAMDAFEAAVLNRELEHPSNPVLNWNIANAVVRTDPAGNRKLDKDKARFRIDGAVALAMALGLKARDRSEPDKEIEIGSDYRITA